MIELDDVHLSNDDKSLLSGVSAKFQKSRLSIIISLNETALSALFRAMAALHPLDAGTMQIDGHATNSEYAKENTVFVLEKPLMHRYLTPRQNLHHYLLLRNQTSKENSNRINDLAREFLLHEDLDRQTRTLSPGIVRGFETIEAFVLEPEYFVLSDLVAHFPDYYLRTLPDKIQQLAAKGTGVITYSISLEIAEFLSDQIDFDLTLVENGQVKRSGFVDDVLSSLTEAEKKRLKPDFGNPKEVVVRKALNVMKNCRTDE